MTGAAEGAQATAASVASSLNGHASASAFYFTIVTLSRRGLECWRAALLAAITSVYAPGRSLLEREMRPWKDTLPIPA